MAPLMAGDYTRLRGRCVNGSTFGERSIMHRALGAIVASGALAMTGPVSAHHSGNMFDARKVLTLTGTVREFQWTNPHCWIQLLVPGSAPGTNATTEWSIEMASPMQVQMGGWKHGTLKPGDRITVLVHPMLDGTPGGNFISAAAADGRTLGQAASAGGR